MAFLPVHLVGLRRAGAVTGSAERLRMALAAVLDTRRHRSLVRLHPVRLFV